MARSVFWPLALIIAVSGCTERKPPFSAEQFALAKAQCRAVDAYMLKAPANAIGFHGSSDDHRRQAKCLRDKLARTDVQTVIIGSQLYERP